MLGRIIALHEHSRNPKRLGVTLRRGKGNKRNSHQVQLLVTMKAVQAVNARITTLSTATSQSAVPCELGARLIAHELERKTSQ